MMRRAGLSQRGFRTGESAAAEGFRARGWQHRTRGLIVAIVTAPWMASRATALSPPTLRRYSPGRRIFRRFWIVACVKFLESLQYLIYFDEKLIVQLAH
jgi:hypothetical protein